MSPTTWTKSDSLTVSRKELLLTVSSSLIPSFGWSLLSESVSPESRTHWESEMGSNLASWKKNVRRGKTKKEETYMYSSKVLTDVRERKVVAVVVMESAYKNMSRCEPHLSVKNNGGWSSVSRHEWYVLTWNDEGVYMKVFATVYYALSGDRCKLGWQSDGAWWRIREGVVIEWRTNWEPLSNMWKILE